MKYIEVKNVTIDIPVFDSNRSLKRDLYCRYLGGGIKKTSNKHICIRALEDVSFRLEEGDRLGLIGHNGAGKSTLLNVLAGIYIPHAGSISINGKVTPLFNTSLGLDIDDTGYENIYTIGMYYGLNKKEIDKRKDEIIAFSELGDFIYLPARTYSSGMLLRLSFAIVTSMKPDILVMDEGLGVGDAKFAQKAEGRLKSFYTNLSILVVASHSNELIKNMCNKAILLEHGKLLKFGNTEEILDLYEQRSLV